MDTEAKPFSAAWLSDPEVFSVRRLKACSDHDLYASMEEADAGVSSRVRSLNGTWKAHFAICPKDAPDELLKSGQWDGTLREIHVPCEFQLENPEWDPPHYVNVMYPWDGMEALVPPQVSETYNPTVTCIRTFSLSEADRDCGRIVLCFGAAEAALALWVNGVFIGYAEDSFTPHRFDVTQAVRTGENRIAARVFKRCTGTWMEDQDFWRFSGIHRDVTLQFEGKCHLRDLFVHTPLDETFTHARVEADLELERPRGTVRCLLTAPDGTAAGETSLPAGETLRVSFPVDAPALWSAETPSLYTLTVELSDETGVLEVSRTCVGIRRFEMRDRVMTLNGKRLVFHGVNRHEFDCDRGRCVPLNVMLEDMRILKAMNVNAIRTCHYPNDPLFYRLCDRYGFYVIDETNIESHGSWARSPFDMDRVVPGDRKEWLGAVLDRGASMLERDKNHPCVLLWSCGNESFGGADLYALSNYFRTRDPSRLVHYEGVCNDPRYPDTTDVHSRMYAKVKDIRAYLDGHPDKPFMNCEYTHAMGNSCGGMHLYRALEKEYPLYQGGFIWDYVDQGLRQTLPDGRVRLSYGGDWGDRPNDNNFNTNGILLGDRSLTPKVQEIRHVFQYAEVLPAKDGVRIENLRLFAPLDDLCLVWQLLEDGVPRQEGRLPLPPIQPGEARTLPLEMTLPEGRTELMLVCRLCLSKDSPLLSAGTCLADGYACLREALPAFTPGPAAPWTEGDFNLGMHTPEFHALFTRGRGAGLCSLKDAAGRETLLDKPRLSLFRAPTDNDHGNGYALREGIWHLFSRYARVEGPHTADENGEKSLRYAYSDPLLPGAEVTLAYRFQSTNSMLAELSFPGVPGQCDLAALGISFELDKRYHRVRYYGLGPDEAYFDRHTGALPGIWRYEASEGYTRYCRPQESGSRYGVRWLEVTDDDGHGLRLEAVDAPLEVSVSPYLPEELTACHHPEELPGIVNHTVLDVAAFRRGVGGDDSWGAPVLEEYTYPSDRPYLLRFRVYTI